MDRVDTTLEIETFGHFSISAAGKPVAINWPDETLKTLFCSLLSPLDLYFTWDRICRAILSEPETRSNRRQLDEIIRHLIIFLAKELAINPLITSQNGIRIDRQQIRIDTFEFYRAVIEGLRFLSLDNDDIAQEKFSRAHALYGGVYMPGMTGKIIENTRKELDSLHQTVVMYETQQAGGHPAAKWF